MTVAILFFVGFVVAVVVAQVFHVNAGFVAIAIGFILFWFFGGKDGALGTSTAFIANFPTTLFWNYAMPVIFYAFATANGTLETLGKKITYKFRNTRWALPIAMYITAAVIAMAGAGTMNTFIVAPLAWGLCLAAGVTPLIIPAALWSGSFLGAFVPWTSNGALTIGMYNQFIPGIDGTAMQFRIAMYYAVLSICFLVVMFIITKAMKVKEQGPDFVLENVSFNKYHIRTLITIFVCIGCLLVPVIINQFAPNPACKWLSSNLGIPVTSVVGITLMALYGGCDFKEVFAKDVNWNIILMITGMGMYCSLAKVLGVVDTLGSALATLDPIFFAPCLCAIGAILSLVTSASTVQPLLFALIPGLAAASGMPVGTLIAATQMGVGVTSFSPFSTGGACCLIGAPANESQALPTKMLIIACCTAIIATLLGFTPFYSIGA